MNIHENRQHQLGEYLKHEVFRDRRSYEYKKKDLSEYNWKQPTQARFKLVMKKGTWTQGEKGKFFPEFINPYYSQTNYSFDKDLQTHKLDEQKGLINLVRLVNKRINSGTGWNYARIYMTTDQKKNTNDQLYNKIIFNLTFDGRIILNDSVKFTNVIYNGQKDLSTTQVDVNKYEWQRLN